MEIGLSIFAIVGTLILPFLAIGISVWRMGPVRDEGASDTPGGAE